MTTASVVIVGSGLTALSAAHALLRQSVPVTMVDVGLMPDGAALSLARELASQPVWQWSAQLKQRLMSSTQTSSAGVSIKKWMGSDFASAFTGQLPRLFDNAKFYSSEARCGLGNIWGCGMLPMLGSDMDDWPISLADLEPHYEEVLQFAPLAAERDIFEQYFSLYCEPQPLSLSSQGRRLLTHMEQKRRPLERAGLTFGAARLAGDFSGREGAGCQQCGMCMYGCPYEVLYSGQSTLATFLKDENFHYISDYIVHSVEQRSKEVYIYGVDRKGEVRPNLVASRVILCAGIPATIQIILNSLKMYRRMIRIKTSEQCYIPMLSLFGNPGIEKERMNTMCQLYWFLQDREVDSHGIHFSIYGHNALYLNALKEILGKAYAIAYVPVQMLLRRMFFAFCYLHSDSSSELYAELQDDVAGTLCLSGAPAYVANQTFGRVRRKLKKLAHFTGLLPAPLYSGMKLPGGGNHLGCAFPMSNSPQEAQCDIYGRIYGMDRVHIGDASCFPSITATTITLSAMANAHRIASHAAAMERA